MARGVGGFDFSDDIEPSLDPGEGDESSIPSPDTSFDIDEFERAAQSSEPPSKPSVPAPEKKTRKRSAPKTSKKSSVPKPEIDKLAVGTYLTLRDGTEVQIAGYRFDSTKLEGFFQVRYPDKIMSGNSYELPENEIYNAKLSTKYENKSSETSEKSKPEKKSKSTTKPPVTEQELNTAQLERAAKRAKKDLLDNLVAKGFKAGVIKNASDVKALQENVEGDFETQKKIAQQNYQALETKYAALSSGSGSGIPPEKPPAPPGPAPDDPNDPDKTPKPIPDQEEALGEFSDKKSLSEIKKQFRDFIREEKDKFAREFRDKKLDLTREVQKLNNEAVSRKTEINRASSESKVAIYSLSAAVGLPGYIVASIVDALIIQPAVKKDIQAEKDYQNALKDYKNQNIDFLNAEKDEFREYIKSNEFDKLSDSIKAQIKETGELPDEALVSFDEWSSRRSPSTSKPSSRPSPLSSGVSTGTTAIPETEQQESAEESADVSKTVDTVTNAASQSSKGTLPTKPVSQSAKITTAVSKAGPIVAAAMEVIGLVNTATKHHGNNIRSDIKSLTDKDGITGSLQLQRNMVDKALGPIISEIHPGAVLFKEASKTFETAVKEFDKIARENLGFSPQALMADIQGSINRLEQDINLGERLDPTKAAMIEVTDEINLIWNEFRALFFETYGPLLIGVLTVIKIILQNMLEIIKFLKNAAIRILDFILMLYQFAPIYGHLASQLRNWLNSQNKPKSVPPNIRQALQDFHDPANQPVKPPRPGNFR